MRFLPRPQPSVAGGAICPNLGNIATEAARIVRRPDYHGRGDLKAKVTGNASSPSIRVNPATILRDVDKGKIDKGLGDLLKKIK